jgi:hypothetical protein
MGSRQEHSIIQASSTEFYLGYSTKLAADGIQQVVLPALLSENIGSYRLDET